MVCVAVHASRVLHLDLLFAPRSSPLLRLPLSFKPLDRGSEALPWRHPLMREGENDVVGAAEGTTVPQTAVPSNHAQAPWQKMDLQLNVGSELEHEQA